jgi:hypothetical protein
MKYSAMNSASVQLQCQQEARISAKFLYQQTPSYSCITKIPLWICVSLLLPSYSWKGRALSFCYFYSNHLCYCDYLLRCIITLSFDLYLWRKIFVLNITYPERYLHYQDQFICFHWGKLHFNLMENCLWTPLGLDNPTKLGATFLRLA